MIKLDGKEIDIKKFPDGTQLLKCCSNGVAKIEWNYENETELVTLIYITKHLKDVYRVEVELIMPYIPNARQDRTKKPEEVFTLKYFSEVINSLGFKDVTVLDPHSSVSEALFDRLTVVSPKLIVEDIIEKNFKEEISENKFSLFFTDEGGRKKYSDMFNIHHTFGMKRRDWFSGKIEDLDIIGDENFIKDKTILIVDDICSYGGTFFYAAKKLKELGAGKIYLYVTHCEDSILNGKLPESGLIEEAFTTNSIFNKDVPGIEVFDLDKFLI